MKGNRKKTTPAPRHKPPEPVMDECEECQGKGIAQATCESCGVGLTTANWKPEHETYACTKCVERDERDAAPFSGAGYD